MSASPSASVPAKKKGPANCGSFTEILSRVGSLGAKVHSCRADTFIINGSGDISVDANAARDVTDLIPAIMRKLTMPAGCIDVTREMRDSGTVISLIGDEVWRAFPSKATKSKAHRPTTSSSSPGNDTPRRHEGRKKP